MNNSETPSPPTDEIERFKAARGDQYTIEDLIGCGGMAEVYRAFDLKHGRPVAIKVLDAVAPHGLGDEEGIRSPSSTEGPVSSSLTAALCLVQA